jgi:hypothetical protein
MKRFALFHIEEELYLNEYSDGYELDSEVYLFTKGELEYIFENKYDADDWDDETVSLDDGTDCHKSEFELLEYRVSEMKRSNFNEFKID